MCGFAGNVNLVGRPVSDKVLSLVLESLSHRGPDARQVWQEGPCTLAHCRLRIIDISARSDQPLERPGRERVVRSEEHTSELQSLAYLVCRLLLEKKKQ